MLRVGVKRARASRSHTIHYKINDDVCGFHPVLYVTLSEMRLRRDSAANRKASSENRKASSENRKVFSEESEGFFQRALGSYTRKFPKRSAASLTCLPRSRLGLPRLRLSRNSGPATEGFSNRGINFKDAYRMCSLLYSKRDGVLCFHYSRMRIANDTYHVRTYERTYASSTMSRHSGAETKNLSKSQKQLTYKPL